MVELIETYMSEASQDYELSTMKVNAVLEAAMRQLNINYAAAELKVVKESGTADDLAYLYEEANNGLVESVMKTIEKIKDAIVKFFSDVRDKVLSLINKKETEEALDSIEKKVKLLPLLGKKKVMVENYNEELKCAQKHLSLLDKLKAKVKSGQDVSADDVEKVEKSFMEEHGKLIGIGAAVAITVTAGLALIKKMRSDAGSTLKNFEKNASDKIDDIKSVIKKIPNPHIGAKLSSAYSTISKVITEDFTRCLSNTMSSIKGAIKSFKNTKVDVDKAKDVLLKEEAEDGEAIDPKDIENAEKEMKEDGEECGDCAPDPIPDEPDTDPWDDVMRELEAGDSSDDLASTLDGEDDETEKCKQEDSNSAFESVYNEIFGDCGSSSKDCGDKPSNDKIVSDLFSEIMSSAKGKTKPVSESATDEESTFDSLMKSIEELSL